MFIMNGTNLNANRTEPLEGTSGGGMRGQISAEIVPFESVRL